MLFLQLKLKELKDAASMGTPVSQPVRELCAARLLTISDSMSKAARPKPGSAAAQTQGAAAAAETEPQQKPSKRARKGDAAQPAEATAAAEQPLRVSRVVLSCTCHCVE